MTAPQATQLLTAEECRHHPRPPTRREDRARARRGGDPHARWRPHCEIAAAIAAVLRTFALKNALGRVGVEGGFIVDRAPDVVRAPDVHFVRADRLPGGRMPPACFDGCLDLAVEVVSPDDTDRDIAEKLAAYLAAGTTHIWVVRPELQTVTVQRPTGDAHTCTAADTLTSDAAGFDTPGFTLPVAAIFA